MLWEWIILAVMLSNVIATVNFSRDVEFYQFRDIAAAMVCCVLPVIQGLYLYKWCDNFVRGVEE